LHVSVDNHFIISNKPYLTYAAQILDRYPTIILVLVDSAFSRQIVIEEGEIIKENEFVSFAIKKHKKGGWSQARFSRHFESHVVHHTKKSIDNLQKLLKKYPTADIILAGQDEIRSLFKKYLPSFLNKKIITETHLDMDSGKEEILKKVFLILDSNNKQKDQKEITKLKEAIPKKGSTKLEEIISAIEEGKVLELFIDPKLKIAGLFCSSCGYLTTEAQKLCPICRKKLTTSKNIIEKLVEKMFSQKNTHLEFIEDNKEFQNLGGIAAIFTY